MKLVDGACSQGWSHLQASDVLGVSDVRVHRWRHRLWEVGSLIDRAPGGNPVHRILPSEEEAILELIEEWGPTDRSHRKLAHRGSYIGKVWVAPSTVRRVAEKHQVSLPEPVKRRSTPPSQPWPDTISWEPNQIWMWDASWFGGARRHCVAIVDVVSRYWIDFLLTPEFTDTQVRVLFASALQDQGLLDLLTPERVDLAVDDPRRPILVAWSDRGPQMTSGDTREFLALVAIFQHLGRPHTPTDQAEIESFYGHVKADWPHLETITDPAVLNIEMNRVRDEYNRVRLHAGIGYVTPSDEHHGRGPVIRRARRLGLKQARQQRIDYNRKHPQDRPGDQP
ncbi:MAG TPA: integrase core domain-containing protein [Acidimicrobiia bacterium]|nr:integrase core domain-containing protein [Acidimicrobiia bacterium]